MAKANATSIEYFKDLRRVADLLNGVVFQGKQVITPGNLREGNPVIHNITKQGNKVSAIENTVDLSIMVALEDLKFLVMLQLQTLEHYAMPVRLFHEKGTDYYNQWKAIQGWHKERDDLKEREERLSGMKKEDHLYPVLQIVIYFGQERWSAAKKMDDLTRVKEFPKELQKLLAEKPMLLFEVCHFKQIERFQTDLQQVCGFLQRTKDKTALQEYVKENEEVFSRLKEDTYDLLTVMSGIKAMKLIKRDVMNIEGGFNMCKAFDDWMHDVRQEGEQCGMRMGVEKGQNSARKLYEKLISAGRINDLMQVSTDDTYFQKLLVEFGIG